MPVFPPWKASLVSVLEVWFLCLFSALTQAGRMTCSYRPCPVLNCPDHALHQPQGAPCPRCKGQRTSNSFRAQLWAQPPTVTATQTFMLAPSDRLRSLGCFGLKWNLSQWPTNVMTSPPPPPFPLPPTPHCKCQRCLWLICPCICSCLKLWCVDVLCNCIF